MLGSDSGIDTTGESTNLFQCMDCGAMVIPRKMGGSMICTTCGSMDAVFELIPDDATIEWIVGRFRIMKGAADGIQAQYKTVLESMKEAADRAQRRYDQFEAWVKPMLEAYYLAHPPSKKKSIDLGGLTIGYRSSAASVELSPGNATKGDPLQLAHLHDALQWARKNQPELVKEEISLKWAELKTWALTHKDVEVPGVKAVEAKETFYVKL